MTDMPHDDFDIPSEDTPFAHLWSKTPDELSLILATPYDPDIQSLLGALNAMTDFITDDFTGCCPRRRNCARRCSRCRTSPRSAACGSTRRHPT